MSLDAARRQALLAVKLKALVEDRWGDSDRMGTTFPGGTALVEAPRAWVLIDDDPARSLGKVLLWADKARATEVHVVVDDANAGGVLARRAGAFDPSPAVWRAVGRDLQPIEPEPAPPLVTDVPPELESFADQLRAAGADPVMEQGMLRGEVLGLEVARVVLDAGRPLLEVGVGKHDRFAQQLVHADVPTHEALVRAVATVRDHRQPDALAHPLKRLAPERWLRATVLRDPSLAGAEHLSPLPAAIDRDDLRQPAAALAAGSDGRGKPLVVACSVGVDLDAVPSAADARLSYDATARLVIVVPARDDHRALRLLAGQLREPAEILKVPDDWRTRQV